LDGNHLFPGISNGKGIGIIIGNFVLQFSIIIGVWQAECFFQLFSRFILLLQNHRIKSSLDQPSGIRPLFHDPVGDSYPSGSKVAIAAVVSSERSLMEIASLKTRLVS